MATATTAVPQSPQDTPPSPPLDLTLRTSLQCDLGMGQMTVTLIHAGEEAFKGILGPAPLEMKFECPTVRANIVLRADFETGRLMGDGSIEALSPVSKQWYDVLRTSDPDGSLLATFDPCGGAMGGNPNLTQDGQPKIDPTKKVGDVTLATPNILRIHVAEGDRFINNVGQMVKRRLFPNHDDFVFNTVASVGCTNDTRHYPDPLSDWFNLFVGYYQIDAPRSSGWTRPFGYESANGEKSEVGFSELVLLGKADWNWFSNWNYGIPMEAIEAAHAEDETSPFPQLELEPKEIGNSWWHHVTVGEFVVASCYESDAPGAAKLQMNTALTPIWRIFFGAPCPRPGHDTSFISTTLNAELYMAYHETDDAFHTCMFGGTIVKDGSKALMQAQLDAVKAVIEKCYPDLGFAARPPDPVAPGEPEPDIEVKKVGGFVRSSDDGGAQPEPSDVSDQPA